MKRTSARRDWQGIETLEPRQLLAAVFWDGGGGDLHWDNPLNWTGDVLPGPSDDVVINAPGSPTIHHGTGATSVNSLWTLDPVELSGGSISTATVWKVAAPLTISGGDIGGAGNLLVNSTVLWTAGTIGGSGKIQVLPGRELDIAGDVTLSGRELVNNGLVVWASGDIDASNATITNLALRTFELRSTGTINDAGGTNSLNNLGLGKVARTGATGTTSTVAIRLHNLGEVEARTGTLSFTGEIVQREAGGILRGGAWTVSSGTGVLDLAGGPITTVWSGNTAPTLITLHGPGSQFPALNGVQHHLSNHIHANTLVLAGGRQFTFPQLIEASGIIVSNPGITTVIPNTMAIEGLVVGSGKVRWAGDGRITWAHMVVGAELNLGGTHDITTVSGLGLLRITGETTWRTGLWVGFATLVEAGGTFNIRGSAIPGSTPEAKFLFRKLINYGTVSWSDTVGEWQLGAEFVNRGLFKIESTGFISTQGGLGPLILPSWLSNYGTIEKTGAGDAVLRGAGGGVRLANQVGGVVHVKAGRLVASGGGLSAGVFRADAGAEMVFGGLANILVGAAFEGAGRVRVANLSVWGGVNATGTGDLIVNPGAILAIGGTGTLTRSVVTNNGVLGLGDDANTTFDSDFVNNGIFGIGIAHGHIAGDLTLASGGIFGVRSDSAVTHGHLTVDGAATLAGTLSTEFRWAAPQGLTFDFLTKGSRVGTFGSTPSTGLPAGSQITVDYAATGAAVRVVPV